MKVYRTSNKTFPDREGFSLDSIELKIVAGLKLSGSLL